MPMSTPLLIWFKGNLIPPQSAVVPVLSPTAQFGLNVFEGIRGYSNPHSTLLYLFRLDDHLSRLIQSCKLIGFDCPYSINEIKEAIYLTIRSNNMHEDLAVRVTLFVDGFGSWSSEGPVDMFVAPVYKPRNTLSHSSGLTACTSTWRRIDDLSLPPRVKSGSNYINGRYAHLEAKSIGADLPILLNSNGKVAEGAGACLMIVRNQSIITPPTTSSILESITRSTIITLAEALNMSIQVREVDRTELYIADEVFLCGSAAEITPLTQIDRFVIGDGFPGPITCRLSSLYFSYADGSNNDGSCWRSLVCRDSAI